MNNVKKKEEKEGNRENAGDYRTTTLDYSLVTGILPSQIRDSRDVDS